MSDNLKLTCVTATFNVIAAGNREALVACIESVAALKIPHEHLVYDGASTDGTAEFLRNLAQTIPGLRVVSEPDTGIYNALNKGVRAARGDWLYVLGADDRICNPSSVDALIVRHAEIADVIVAQVFGGPEYPLFDPARDLKKTLFGMPYCHQGVFMRTSVIRDLGGFPERYRISADYDLILRAHLAHVRFAYAKRLVARFGMSGVSCRREEETVREVAGVLSERLCVPFERAVRWRVRGYIGLTVSLRYLVHPDMGIRMSARAQFARWRERLLLGFLSATGIGLCIRLFRGKEYHHAV